MMFDNPIPLRGFPVKYVFYSQHRHCESVFVSLVLLPVGSRNHPLLRDIISCCSAFDKGDGEASVASVALSAASCDRVSFIWSALTLTHSHHSLFQSGVKKYLRRVSQEGVSQIVLHIWLHVFCRPAFAFQHVPRGALWSDSRRCGLTIIYLPCFSLLFNMTTFCHSPITCIYII